MNWITKQVAEVINDVTDAALNFFSDFIIGIFDKDIELFSSQEIAAACTVTKTIAITLVIIFSLKHIWDIYVTETDGDNESDPMQILTNAAISLALIEANDFIFTTLQTLSKNFSSDLAGSVSASDYTVKMSSLIALLAKPDETTIMIGTMAIFSIIIIIVFSFIAGKRAAELVLMKVLLPIMAIDKMGTGKERWNSFFETYVQTFFGYAFQLFLLRIAMNKFVAAFVEGIGAKFGNYFIAFCLVWVAIKTPKWLDRFTYSSGLGNFASGTMRTIVNSAILRRR